MFKVSASLEHACLQSVTKFLDSPCHRFLMKVTPDHLQSCATFLNCWWLTVSSSFCLRDCKTVMLTTYVINFNSKTCRIDATSLMPWFYLSSGWRSSSHRTCNARLVTRHCNDFIAKHEWPPNSPDLNLLDYHVWGPMLKAYHKLDIISWTSKPSTTEERQTRLEMMWNDLPQKPVARAVI